VFTTPRSERPVSYLQSLYASRRATRFCLASVCAWALCVSPNLSVRAYAAQQQPPTIAQGTVIAVRTSAPIRAENADGRVLAGLVTEDVFDTNHRLLIPRGSTAELLVRKAPNNELSLDLDSLTINGERYAIAPSDAVVGTAGTAGIGTNRQTAEYVGGGALLGTLVGGVAGGVAGAAIGAAAGAAAGAATQVVAKGRVVAVPADALLTYRLERDLNFNVPDTGVTRTDGHYHALEQFGGSLTSSDRIFVAGNQQWTPTGIRVRSGDVLHFHVTGDIYVSPDRGDRAEAQGMPGRPIAGSPLPTEAGGALVGIIDDGQPFLIGNQPTVAMPASGILFLGINDNDVVDNSGRFEVVITR
jgi:hypothetical protein